jgi:hypothetical protein
MGRKQLGAASEDPSRFQRSEAIRATFGNGRLLGKFMGTLPVRMSTEIESGRPGSNRHDQLGRLVCAAIGDSGVGVQFYVVSFQ